MDVMLNELTTLSAGTLVDVALNVVGFLAAGGFFLVISSMIRDRRKRKSTTAVTEQPLPNANAPEPAVDGKTSLSFVSLASERRGQTTETEKSAPVETAAESMRRNRAEVIEMARKMIAARESREAIAGKLPISEAELSMLSEQ